MANENAAKLEKAMGTTSDVPKKNGVCDVCGGRIIKQVRSLFRGQYRFDPPKCESCGTGYYGAEDQAIPVGIKEFEQMMDQPFTI